MDIVEFHRLLETDFGGYIDIVYDPRKLSNSDAGPSVAQPIDGWWVRLLDVKVVFFWIPLCSRHSRLERMTKQRISNRSDVFLNARADPNAPFIMSTEVAIWCTN